MPKYCENENKNDIIKKIAESNLIRFHLANNVYNKSYIDDFLQDIYLYIAEIPEPKLITLNKNEKILWKYIWQLVDNQTKNGTLNSKYVSWDKCKLSEEYIKEDFYLFELDESEKEWAEKNIERINILLQEESWYRKDIFLQRVYGDEKLKDMSVRLNISISNLHYAYSTTVKNLKNKLKNDNSL